MEDLAIKLGLPKETLKDKYSNSFNEYLKVFLGGLQDEVKQKAAEDPSLLKVDPEWDEKLNDVQGFMDYLEKFEVNLSPETFYKYPEVNKMILEMKPDEFVQNFAQLYLNGIINEDRMRLDPHVNTMKNWSTKFEQQANDTLTINNEMWVTKLREDSLNYIKTVLSPEFKNLSLSYAKTEDNMRVDIGLAISRDPIFLTYFIINIILVLMRKIWNLQITAEDFLKNTIIMLISIWRR
jgi:hypothetical protein